MDASILEQDKKNNKVSILLKGASPAYVNMIRRTITESVPTMAIEDVEFRKNSSILYDEIIAHRLGLLPLTTDLKTYNLISECKCEGKGCARCSVTLTLSAKGAGIVYASDLKSSDPKIKPVFPNTPIAKLLKGQDIELEATAVLGSGDIHAKWTPGLCWHTYKPEITVNNKSSKFDEFKEKFPPQIFDKSGKIDKNLINSPSLIDAVDGVCEDIVKIEFDDTSSILYIESWGQLSCKEILIKAFEVADTKLDELNESINNIK